MSESELQYKKMTETSVGKLIVSLSIPTIISMMVTSIYNMADTYFVGTLGTSASGATGIVFGLMGILQAFGFMFGHGAGSNISRKLGAKNIEEAREYASTSFFLSIASGAVIAVLGLLFMNPFMRLLGSTDTILPYARVYAFFILIAGPAMTSSCVMNNILRYEGKAFYAMIGLTLGGVLNIFGDAILIKGLGMGIAGAGLSTTVSQYISMFVLLLPYITGKTQSKFSLRYFTRRMFVVQNIISCGLPSLARQGLNSVSTMLLNHSAALYGDAAIAAISIVMRIINFLFCVAIGIGQGLQPVAAFNYGAGKYSRVKKAFYYALGFGIVIMSILAVVGIAFRTNLVALFRDDSEVIAIGSAAMFWQSIALVFMPISMYGNMVYQAIGNGRVATFLASMRSGIVLIPVLYLLTHFLGLQGLETAQAVSEVISACITVPFLVALIKNLPEDEKILQ